MGSRFRESSALFAQLRAVSQRVRVRRLTSSAKELLARCWSVQLPHRVAAPLRADHRRRVVCGLVAVAFTFHQGGRALLIERAMALGQQLDGLDGPHADPGRAWSQEPADVVVPGARARASRR